MRFLLISIGCVLAGLAVVQRDNPPQARQLSGVARADSVMVAHQLITVEPASPPLTRLARATQKERPVTQTATQTRPFLARARHLVLGDGRFRPQPFPQPASR